LALRRPGYRIFRVEKFGAPEYPELVLCARRGTVARRPGFIRAVVKTLVRGYELAIERPAVAGAALERQVPGLDPTLVRADLAALRSSFATADGRPGELDMPALRAWATWEARFHLVRHRPDVAGLFDPRFAH
jgi:ABC-type nitrate/sulfonate/bicarbonate transport system substrate-binding protein